MSPTYMSGKRISSNVERKEKNDHERRTAYERINNACLGNPRGYPAIILFYNMA